jgi:predicted PurR-regulated permease PerM
MTEQSLPPVSPRWGSNIKLIVGLTVVAVIAALVIYFRSIVGPLLLAFIIVFLLHPVVGWASRTLRISWRASTSLIYVILVIFLIALFTVTGLAVLQQTQSLFDFVKNFITDLPATIEELSTKVYAIGPFQFDLARLDLETLAQQTLNLVEPVLGQAGNLVGKFASGAATTVWWGLFVLFVSYFFLSEADQVREPLVNIEISGYHADFQRLLLELNRIWNSFLRGQLIISFLIIITYYIMLSILGTRLALAIAIVAGMASFVPYFGPAVAWVTAAIIAYLQTDNYFGLAPAYYAALVVALCLALNQIFDYLISPRIMGQALGVHPAGVLIAAIVATDLIGIIGLVLAAPVLASVTLIGRYIGRKMFDLPPWPPESKPPPRPVPPWIRLGRRLRTAWHWIQKRLPFQT